MRILVSGGTGIFAAGEDMFRYEKVYIAVILYVGTDGRMKPIALDWEDGRRFPIDKVVSERNCPPDHVGAILTRRFDVRMEGKEKTMYLELQTGKWFVEKPTYR